MRSFVLVLALAPAAHGAGVEDPTRPQETAERHTRLVEALRLAQPGSAPDAEFLEDARLSPHVLFALLREGTLPAPAGDEERPLPLHGTHEQWILAGVRAVERPQILALARGELAAGGDPRTRAAALRFIGSVGQASELEELLRLALPEGALELERCIAEALQRAAGECFARDEGALAFVSARWRSLREPLLEPMILAAGEAPGAPALEFLSEVIHWRADHARLALAKVQEIGRSLDPLADERACQRIRPLLDRARPELCRAAALALGALGDRESIPDLIELLEEGAGLRANAHWALARITGLALSASCASWSRWYELESAWMRASGRAALERLRSPDVAEVLDSVRALSAHPLAREELVLGLVELLASESSEVLVLVCRVLPDLGDARAYPGLTALLADPDPAVSAAVCEALRAMSGCDLPCESEAWEALFARA